MTKDEALDLALEALKQIYTAMPFPAGSKAIAAIKQARSAPVQEPEYVYTCNGCNALYREDSVSCDCTVNGLMEFTRHILAPDTTPPAAPAQEPDHGDELTSAYMSGVHRGKELAAQRQWVGLTDEEIEAIWYDHHDREMGYAMRFARAIEAKLRSKNNG